MASASTPRTQVRAQLLSQEHVGEDLETALDVEFDAGAAERIRSSWWASQTAQIGPVLHGQRVISHCNTRACTRS
jgi:hypothetical protein